MVRSVNGDIGSSVLPLGGDDWMFLGRGRHVWIDNNDIHFSGSNGVSLSDGIAASGTSKISTTINATNTTVARLQTAADRSSLIAMERIGNTSDYKFCCGGWHV